MKKLFLILLAASVAILPFAVSCKKVEQPSEEVVEQPDEPDDDSPQGGGSQGGGGSTNPGSGSGGGNSGGGHSGSGNSDGGNSGGGNGGGSSSKPAKALHNWTVNYCIISISGDGISVMAGFHGCDIEEIARMAERNGAKIDVSKVAGYKITRISLFDDNTLAVYFANNEVFRGTYALKGQNISYTFGDGGKDVIGEKAEGTLTFPSGNEAVLILNTQIKEYSGSVELNLSEASGN